MMSCFLLSLDEKPLSVNGKKRAAAVEQQQVDKVIKKFRFFTASLDNYR